MLGNIDSRKNQSHSIFGCLFTLFDQFHIAFNALIHGLFLLVNNLYELIIKLLNIYINTYIPKSWQLIILCKTIHFIAKLFIFAILCNILENYQYLGNLNTISI